MGDAAHAVLPHYGQGVNAGFENCLALDRGIAHLGPDWPRVFPAFEAERRPDAEALAELCLEHARELHELVATPEYDMRLQLEAHLHRLCPNRTIPLYSMMAFTTMRYREVLARHRIQRRIIDGLLSHASARVPVDAPDVAAITRADVERELSVLESDPA
jgi:kynurenine 3-monooxygenase